jgi:hypothetical protein
VTVTEVLRVATELHVPVRVGRNWFGQYPYLEQALGPAGLAVDRTISIPPEVPPENNGPIGTSTRSMPYRRE